MILILLVLTTLLVNKIIHSRMGDAILAIRDDDLAAGAMGINVFKYKTLAIVIASMLAGVAGAFYAVYTSYIDPSCFTNAVSNNMLVMVIFGGLGNMFGSFLGGAARLLGIPADGLRRNAGHSDAGAAGGTVRLGQLQVYRPAPVPEEIQTRRWLTCLRSCAQSISYSGSAAWKRSRISVCV